MPKMWSLPWRCGAETSHHETGSLTCICTLMQEQHQQGVIAGVDLATGSPLNPMEAGIYDLYTVKRQSLHLTSVIASQFLLTDEILKAGKKMGKGGPSMPGMESMQ